MGKRDQFVRLARRLLGGGTGPEKAASIAPPEVRTPPPVGDVRLADLWALRSALEEGDRPRLVNHWATWCEGCVEELPALVELHRRFGDRVAFLGISWELFQGNDSPGEAVRTVAGAMREHGAGWPTLLFEGVPRELFLGLELADEVIPQTFVYDADGKTLFHHVGPIGSAEAHKIEESLKAE